MTARNAERRSMRDAGGAYAFAGGSQATAAGITAGFCRRLPEYPTVARAQVCPSGENDLGLLPHKLPLGESPARAAGSIPHRSNPLSRTPPSARKSRKSPPRFPRQRETVRFYRRRPKRPYGFTAGPPRRPFGLCTGQSTAGSGRSVPIGATLQPRSFVVSGAGRSVPMVWYGSDPNAQL